MNALVDIPGTVAKHFKFENLKGLTNPQLRYLQSGAAREPQETAQGCGESANQAVGLRRTERSIERLDTTEIDVPKPLKTRRPALNWTGCRIRRSETDPFSVGVKEFQQNGKKHLSFLSTEITKHAKRCWDIKYTEGIHGYNSAKE